MQPRPVNLYLILDLGLGDGVSHGLSTPEKRCIGVPG